MRKVSKIIVLLMFINVCDVFGEVFFLKDVLISTSADKVTMKEVFRRIEAETDCVFLIDDEIEQDMERIVSIEAKNQKLSDVLDMLFAGTNLDYSINGRQITVFKNTAKAVTKVIEKAVLQQPEKLRISGVVKDDRGEPLPGVNVTVKGTTSGIVTDIDGRYSLEVSGENDVLVFSYVGFTRQEQKVGKRRTIDVVMAEDATEIKELVVVGYGIQKKESIVGSIVRTTNEEIMKSGNVTDLKQALTGRLPGVITSTSTGEPGGYADGSSATSIFIRGRNSWNNSQPLILVDGVERNMDNIDVSEVAEISVLKDASATAVFGVKGANGVILITTKRGENSKPQLTFNYDATAKQISKVPEKLDSYDALRLRNETIEREVSLDGNAWTYYTPMEIMRRYRERDYPEYEMLYPNVDWKNALFKETGWSHKASLNIQGGTNFVKYFGSLSYLHEGDMFQDYDNGKGYDPGYDFDRFNFRSNLDFSLTKTTNLKINLAGYYSQKNTNYSYYNQLDGSNPRLWGAVYQLAPDVFLPQYEDGSWGVYQSANDYAMNPVAALYNLGLWERRTTSLNADFSLEQKLDFITKGLSVTGSFFYDNSFQTVGGINDLANAIRAETDSNTPQMYVYPGLYMGHDQPMSEYMQFANIAAATNYDWIVRPWVRNSEAVSATYTGVIPVSRRMSYQAQLNYNRLFGDVHNVGAMAVFKREEYSIGSMFPYYREDWAFRTTYDYASLYFFEANGAYNGSEKFSPDYRFDFFPSFAAGWYISNEKFWKIDWFSKLKLRYSLGWVGDDSGGGRWLYQPQYAYSDAAHMESGIAYGAAAVKSPYNIMNEIVVPNIDARWEKARKSNFGIEAGLWKGMLSVNFDYFTEHRTDIMIKGADRAIPPYFGATPPAANLGIVDAKGFELEVNWHKHTAIGLDYWASLAITHTRNNIVFADDPLLQPDYLKDAGYAIDQTRALINSDVYQTWDEVYASTQQQVNDPNKMPGFYNIIDFNGDGVITETDDRAPYGYPEVPENTYNLMLGASYKGFSLNLQFYGVNNVTRYLAFDNYIGRMNTVYAHALDYWSKDNPGASSFLPRYLTEGEFIGNYYYYDASYIRLKTVELAYQFPAAMLKKLGGMSALRLFVNGNNLWFWSRLPDDRENAWNGGTAEQGAYPSLRRINFGFNVSF
jgi:TonB-linked SusC/RagA family outer membrane protein